MTVTVQFPLTKDKWLNISVLGENIYLYIVIILFSFTKNIILIVLVVVIFVSLVCHVYVKFLYFLHVSIRYDFFVARLFFVFKALPIRKYTVSTLLKFYEFYFELVTKCLILSFACWLCAQRFILDYICSILEKKLR